MGNINPKPSKPPAKKPLSDKIGDLGIASGIMYKMGNEKLMDTIFGAGKKSTARDVASFPGNLMGDLLIEEGMAVKNPGKAIDALGKGTIDGTETAARIAAKGVTETFKGAGVNLGDVDTDKLTWTKGLMGNKRFKQVQNNADQFPLLNNGAKIAAATITTAAAYKLTKGAGSLMTPKTAATAGGVIAAGGLAGSTANAGEVKEDKADTKKADASKTASKTPVDDYKAESKASKAPEVPAKKEEAGTPVQSRRRIIDDAEFQKRQDADQAALQEKYAHLRSKKDEPSPEVEETPIEEPTIKAEDPNPTPEKL